MKYQDLINWLLKGDVSIQYQVHRDLLQTNRLDLRDRIETEGWGHRFLSKRNEHGHWGLKYYQPKWTSSHYTLLDLKYLGITPNNIAAKDTISLILDATKSKDGGICPIGTVQLSDVCLNGMFLNFACYFQTEEEKLHSIIDFILKQPLKDGGFNCFHNRYKTKHSSMHSTLSVAEGITEYEKNGYTYRLEELKKAKALAIEFLLIHQLFISDRTGEIIKKDFLKLTYPGRWRYDILKALDYFQYAEIPWDDRMQPAIDVLCKKRKKDGRWNVQAKHPGQVHFTMEKAGKPSRWNTLRALRVINYYGLNESK